jgi:predicted nucleotidyltransferase
MTAAPGIEFQKTWENRNTVKFHGQELHLLSKEDLITLKKASGRNQDIEDIRLLRIDENSTHE